MQWTACISSQLRSFFQNRYWKTAISELGNLLFSRVRKHNQKELEGEPRALAARKIGARDSLGSALRQLSTCAFIHFERHAHLSHAEEELRSKFDKAWHISPAQTSGTSFTEHMFCKLREILLVKCLSLVLLGYLGFLLSSMGDHQVSVNLQSQAPLRCCSMSSRFTFKYSIREGQKLISYLTSCEAP